MRVLVFGSRHLTVAHLPEVLAWLARAYRPGLQLVHGDGPPGDTPGAIGADKLSEVALWMLAPDALPPVRFPPEWRVHGECSCPPRAPTCKAAGPRRNRLMLEKGRPEGWLAFPLRGRGNRGTHNMRRLVEDARIPGRVVLLE